MTFVLLKSTHWYGNYIRCLSIFVYYQSVTQLACTVLGPFSIRMISACPFKYDNDLLQLSRKKYCLLSEGYAKKIATYNFYYEPSVSMLLLCWVTISHRKTKMVHVTDNNQLFCFIHFAPKYFPIFRPQSKVYHARSSTTSFERN